MKQFLIKPQNNAYTYEYSLIGILNGKSIVVDEKKLMELDFQKMLRLNLISVKELPELEVNKVKKETAKSSKSKKKPISDNIVNNEKKESGISESSMEVISIIDETDATVESETQNLNYERM